MKIEELLKQYRDNDYYNLSKIENITKLCEEIEKLNNKIDKAIEYIKQNGHYDFYNLDYAVDGNELLNILQGSDE